MFCDFYLQCSSVFTVLVGIDITDFTDITDTFQDSLMFSLNCLISGSKSQQQSSDGEWQVWAAMSIPFSAVIVCSVQTA